MGRIDQGSQTLRADGLLLLTAVIWGFAFVAQRVGMEHVGPFGFNGVRFALGCLVLLPLLCRNGARGVERPSDRAGVFSSSSLGGGLLAGLVLFAGASFQQVALVYTTAGNAGFITGLYVVLVPIIGIALGHRTHAGTWTGAALAAVGLYLLSVVDGFTISPGDLLVLIGAFFWAGHVHLIGWLSPRHDPLKIAFLQYAACAALSLIVSVVVEQNTARAISVGSRSHPVRRRPVRGGGLHPPGGGPEERQAGPRRHHLEPRGGLRRHRRLAHPGRDPDAPGIRGLRPHALRHADVPALESAIHDCAGRQRCVTRRESTAPLARGRSARVGA